MEAVIPIVITALSVYGLFRRVNIFESFIEGAKEGFATVKFIAPTMIALLVAVGTLRASGALDYLAEVLRPLAQKVGATALLTGIYESNGPDSFVGRCASVVAGSTETTFYAVSMYYGAVGITRIRHTLVSALLADFTAIVISVVTVGWLMG